MYKLDQLTNQHYTPKPIDPRQRAAGLGKDVGAIETEEAVPLVQTSVLSMKGPEEIQKNRSKTLKEHEELERGELKAVRRNRKQARKNAIKSKLATGEMTVADLEKRQEKLDVKNAAQKAVKLARGQVKDRQKKVRASELLTQASQNVQESLSAKKNKKDGLKSAGPAGGVRKESKREKMAAWEKKTKKGDGKGGLKKKQVHLPGGYTQAM